MPRRSRIRLPGLPLHTVQRGVNRTACFLSDGDRMHYLDLLGRAAAGEGCSVHAYVLMSNHVHMLVSPSEPSSPSRMMKRLGEVYVAHFNKRHGRTGTLWEGRFKSSVVDSALYLLQCYRYIELNPVRAGMVTRPRDHPWSSYRANAEGAASILLTPHPEYIALAATVEERCASTVGCLGQRCPTMSSSSCAVRSIQVRRLAAQSSLRRWSFGQVANSIGTRAGVLAGNRGLSPV